MPQPKLIDFDMRRPFTRAEAVAAGVSPSALRGANFCRIFRGVYIHSSVPAHPLIRVRAALLIHPPGAFASHASAARVYGVPVPTLPDEHVSVFEEKDRRRRPGNPQPCRPAGHTGDHCARDPRVDSGADVRRARRDPEPG